MTWLTDALRFTGTLLLDLVLLAAVLAAARFAWLAVRQGRRHQLVVEDLANLTGEPELDARAAALTQELRESLLGEFRLLDQRARHLLHQASYDTGRSAASPPQAAVEDSLRGLAASVQALAPTPAQPAVALVTQLLLRPAGTRIRGRLLRSTSPGSAEAIGLGFELADLRGEQSPGTFSVWPADGTDDVIEVSARVLAVEWLRRDLTYRLRRRFWWWPASRRTAVVSRFTGLLYQASAPTYPRYEAQLLESAVDALTEAYERLSDDAHVARSLGFTRIQLSQALRARGRSAEADELFRRGLADYQHVEELLLARVQDPTVLDELRGIRLFRMLAAAESTHPSEIAAGDAHADELLAELDRAEPGWNIAEESNGTLLYNAACLLSLRLGRTDDRELAGRLARSAALLLGYALRRDTTSEHGMSARVGTEPDLAALRSRCDLTALADAVTGPHPGDVATAVRRLSERDGPVIRFVPAAYADRVTDPTGYEQACRELGLREGAVGAVAHSR